MFSATLQEQFEVDAINLETLADNRRDAMRRLYHAKKVYKELKKHMEIKYGN